MFAASPSTSLSIKECPSAHRYPKVISASKSGDLHEITRHLLRLLLRRHRGSKSKVLIKRTHTRYEKILASATPNELLRP